MSGREHHNQWRIQDFGEGGGAFPPGGKGGDATKPWQLGVTGSRFNLAPKVHTTLRDDGREIRPFTVHTSTYRIIRAVHTVQYCI